jgi:drug/metabolite transporter (DMT)-like permease
MKELFLGLICALMITSGQVCWKLAMIKEKFSFSSGLTFKKTIDFLFSPLMVLGVIIYIFATVFWMFLLSRYEYSKIYPILASAYVFALLFAYFLFGETIGANKIFGVLLIMAGIFLIVK